MHFKTFLFLIVLAISFVSCEIINPEEKVPAYLQIDTILIRQNGSGNEKAITAKIPDAWIFINDNSRGVWELPATVPILNHGDHSLKVAGGIVTNGLEGFRANYPFWDFYLNDTTFTLEETKITKVTPVIQYYEETKFPWIEDFESAGISMDSIAPSKTAVTFTSETGEVRSGASSGKIKLTSTNNYFKGVCSESYELPTGSNPVYFELDYKSNIDFTVFIIANYANGLKDEVAVIGFKPKLNTNGSPIWNKLYVDLSFDVSTYYEAINYQVGIAASLPDDENNGYLIFDNLKLVHF